MNRTIQIIERTFMFLEWAVIAVIIGMIAIMVLRLIAVGADLNPFNWFSRTTRRLSDPFVMPVRSSMLRVGVDPKFAPLVVILVAGMVLSSTDW